MNHYHYAWYLAQFSRWEEAIAEHRRAQELDPLTVIHTARLAAVYGFSGRVDDAVAAARKSIEINEKEAPAWVALAFSSAGQGRFEQAMEAAERAQAINPVWTYVVGAVHAKAGRRDEALKIVTELEARKPTGTAALQFAHLHSVLGKPRRGLPLARLRAGARHAAVGASGSGIRLAPRRCQVHRAHAPPQPAGSMTPQARARPPERARLFW